MEEYMKIKLELTDKISCDYIMDIYGVDEYDPQDLTIGVSGTFLTIYKKSDELKELNKYI
ncbi:MULTISPECIES: hypothetical protein [unclassified Clostridium]|uniref:hypothetical protein n=1 Tax=unclassified Clostridium TaxID=2614128 RepID=UPI0013EE64C2|nr:MULTISPECIES: hypothetical protein [unclassified Clostridium]MBZ9691176.1 hypothetical protein [Clostridium sp. M14]